MNLKPIRVLIVDDSALVRKFAAVSLAKYSDITVVGTAPDPYVARDRILELNPDVVTLDIEMPRMDGITFLKVLMKHRPIPVIIMSSLSQNGSEKALEALHAGAVDVLGKPNGAFSALEDGFRLAEKIRAAAVAQIRPGNDKRIALAPTVSKPVLPISKLPAHRRLILLGASTGGTEALKAILTSMRGDLPGIAIVQHIPAHFSKAFADRLNQICAMEVREAKNGDVIMPGLALVAPGGYHLLLKRNGANYSVELNLGPQIHHQRPAVDILFDSAVKCGAGPCTIAALLTGMGVDGAGGLLRLREAGATTIAQNEETCVVFGMPREAIRIAAAQHVMPLENIGSQLERLSQDCSPSAVRQNSNLASLTASDFPGEK